MSEQKRDREEEFNLITILDELPAAQYLWYDNVPHRKKMVVNFLTLKKLLTKCLNFILICKNLYYMYTPTHLTSCT